MFKVKNKDQIILMSVFKVCKTLECYCLNGAVETFEHVLLCWAKYKLFHRRIQNHGKRLRCNFDPTIFAKSFILDVCQGSKCASALIPRSTLR